LGDKKVIQLVTYASVLVVVNW